MFKCKKCELDKILNNNTREGRHLTLEERIALQAEEIKQLWQENEQLRAQLDEWKYEVKCHMDEVVARDKEIEKLRDELKRYKQAEQEGRLYNLPLKPGDTIYRPEALQYCWVITWVEICEDGIVFIDDSDNIFRPDDIGKTVFLTREEAEKALEVRE